MSLSSPASFVAIPRSLVFSFQLDTIVLLIFAYSPVHTMTSSESNSETASKSGAVDTEAQVAPISQVETVGSPTKSEAHDANIVDWDGPHDPNNPRNWTKGKKWAHIIMVSLFALVTNMAPTMCVPGAPILLHEFHVTSSTLAQLAITIYVLGLAVGPMILSPLSEAYGRLPIYHASNLLFLLFLVGCGLSKTVAQFMVFRFISGCMGGVPMPLGGATIADLLEVDSRPVAMALFSLGPLTGPVSYPQDVMPWHSFEQVLIYMY